MKRIVMKLTVALVITAMMVAMAMPAFAQGRGEGGEGTCFGDSGDPYFLPNHRTIVAITSFGLNDVCAGVSYGQRIDLPVVLRWVHSFL
jgi:hypothetical protein